MSAFSLEDRIGIVRGGYGPGHILSLKDGGALIDLLSKENENVHDIFVSPYGEWYWRGVATSPEKALAQADIVWNVTHNVPESNIHPVLGALSKRVIGPTHYVSRELARHSSLAKILRTVSGVYVPQYRIVTKESLYDDISFILAHFTLPIEVLSNFTVHVKEPTVAWDALALTDALEELLEAEEEAFVREHLAGETYYVLLVNGYRGSDVYAFPVFTESDMSPFLSKDDKRRIEHVARELHSSLDCPHISLGKIVQTHDKRLHVSSFDSHIPWSKKDLFSRVTEQVGSSLREFVKHLFSLA